MSTPSFVRFINLSMVAVFSMACHSKSTSDVEKSGQQPEAETTGDTCRKFCLQLDACDAWGGDYGGDQMTACLESCADQMAETAAEAPECIQVERNYVACVSDLNCADFDVWSYSDDESDSYPCQQVENRYVECLVTYMTDSYEDDDYWYDDYYDDDYWDDYYSDDLYPDPCEAYEESERCGEWDAYWGDAEKVFAVNEYELDQLANCRCVRGDLSVATRYVETLSLPALEEIHGDLKIISNEVMSDVSMANLAIVFGELQLYNNQELQRLSFPKLTQIEKLSVTDCAPIATLDGLSRLETITATSGTVVEIQRTTLENVDALSGLTALQGTILLDANDNLTDVSGLMNVTAFEPDSGDALLIIDNPALPTCNALELRDALNPPTMPICIMDNLADECDNDYSGC